MAEDVSFEREKWQAERAFREREISAHEAELELKRREHASRWRSPVVLAILATAGVALGTVIGTVLNARGQRDLEDRKAEQTRILEMIKTGNPDKAAENLAFLVRLGLINDLTLAANLREFLAERKPGSGPTLPVPAIGAGGGPGPAETFVGDESNTVLMPESVIHVYVFLQDRTRSGRGSSEEIANRIKPDEFFKEFRRYQEMAKRKNAKLIVAAVTQDGRWVHDQIIFKGERLRPARYYHPAIDKAVHGAEIPLD